MSRRRTAELVTIVVAWTVEEHVYDGKPYAADMGQRPGMRVERQGRAAVWLRQGTKADVRKAKEYAAKESGAERTMHVFVYPTTEQEPLERARRDVLALEGKP